VAARRDVWRNLVRLLSPPKPPTTPDLRQGTLTKSSVSAPSDSRATLLAQCSQVLATGFAAAARGARMSRALSLTHKEFAPSTREVEETGRSFEEALCRAALKAVQQVT
jgi:hypothetical protein